MKLNKSNTKKEQRTANKLEAETVPEPAPVAAQDLKSLTYAQLRTKAKELGVKAKGTKAELLKKVKRALKKAA